MELIFFNTDKVFHIFDAGFVVEYTPKSVVIVGETGGTQTVHFPFTLEVMKTDIDSAYEALIGRGVDCALLEKELGVNPETKIGFHVQNISDATAEDGRTLHRIVDLQTMPILPLITRIRTVWKVKHYYDEARTQYAGPEFPDTVRTLIANNFVRIPLPNGSTAGEYDLFAGPVMNGEATKIKEVLTITVQMRDAEGRFN